jgi:predicted acyl esterase
MRLSVMRGGAYDQREGPRFFGSREPYLPLAARSDVLVFETEPLAADLEVTGPVAAWLWQHRRAGGHRAHAQHRPQHPVPRQASRLARDLAHCAHARVSLARL